MNKDTMELKIFSPLTAHFLEESPEYDDDDFCCGDSEGWKMSGADLVCYEENIRKAVQNELLEGEATRGLMVYFHDYDSPTVDEKVLSAFPDVEVYDGKLWGVLKCTLKEPLTTEEFAALSDYWTGQMSDGWGEGFEQRPLHIDGGEMYVHFWHSGDSYRTMQESELKAPKKRRKPNRDSR